MPSWDLCSYEFWKDAGGLLITGHTGTNVMDVQVTVMDLVHHDLDTYHPDLAAAPCQDKQTVTFPLD